MIKACLQTHKGAPRGTSRCRRSPNNSLPCLFSRPSQELSAHQRPISTRSWEDKSNMVIQLAASEEGSPCLVLPRAVPVESLFQCLSMKPTMMGQPWNIFSTLGHKGDWSKLWSGCQSLCCNQGQKNACARVSATGERKVSVSFWDGTKCQRPMRKRVSGGKTTGGACYQRDWEESWQILDMERP